MRDELKVDSVRLRRDRRARVSGWLSLPQWGKRSTTRPKRTWRRFDAQLIGSAKTSIDFASYALTDRVIIAALTARPRIETLAIFLAERRARPGPVKPESPSPKAGFFGPKKAAGGAAA